LLAYPKAPFWTFRRLFETSTASSGEILSYLSELAPGLDPEALVSDLSVGQRHYKIIPPITAHRNLRQLHNSRKKTGEYSTPKFRFIHCIIGFSK
jgi:hypothetical protein